MPVRGRSKLAPQRRLTTLSLLLFTFLGPTRLIIMQIYHVFNEGAPLLRAPQTGRKQAQR